MEDVIEIDEECSMLVNLGEKLEKILLDIVYFVVY